MKNLPLIFCILLSIAAHGAAPPTKATIQVDNVTGELGDNSLFWLGNSNRIHRLISPQVLGASNILQTAITANTFQLATNTARMDINQLAFDLDADAYVGTVGMTDPQEILQVHRFVLGLKGLGLWTSCVQLFDLRSHHNIGSGTTLYALKGNNGAIAGAPTWNTNGLIFTSNAVQYVQFNNPMPALMTNVSFMVGFKATLGYERTLVNNFSFNAGTTGWWIGAHGSPSDGAANPYSMAVNYSLDGTTTKANPNGGRFLGGTSVTTFHQVGFWGYSPTEFSIEAGVDSRSISVTNQAAVSNPGSDWRIGCTTITTAVPHSGDVGFFACWNVYLTERQYRAVNRLYSTTIGVGYAPAIEAIFEGDSLTEGTFPADFTLREELRTNSVWGPKIAVTSYAIGGDNASNIVRTSQSQWCAMRVDNRFFAKQYFFIWAGINDLALDFSATTVMTNLLTLWDSARSYGMKVVGFTLTPAPTYLVTTPRLIEWTNLNALIRLNAPAHLDYLIDVTTNTNLQDAANTTYFNSGLHLTQSGYQEVMKTTLQVIPTP